MGKKDKKKKEEPPVEIPVEIEEEELEPEPEEVQFTETSYTSASFESLPPIIVEDKPKEKKKKGKKKLDEKDSGLEHAGSELFNWSEDSLPPVPSEVIVPIEAIEEEPPPKPKGKKGKKGKKEVEEIPDFEKPKNWKQMNKKDREQWLVERIEQWRAEKEAEKQALLAGAKEKRLAAARQRNELMARDVDEQDTRRDILSKTVVLFNRYERLKIDQLRKSQLAAEWAQYLKCDGLPDPRVVTQMNTYLHVWELLKTCDADELDRKFEEVLPMLEMLEQLVANVRQFTPQQVKNYDEIRINLRTQLAEAIQKASFYLLRDLEKHLVFESTKLATYERAFKGLRLNIWVAIKWPTRKRKTVEPDPEPTELTFPSMHVSVKLPSSIDASCLCVRAARSMIDLLSERSRSFGVLEELPDKYIDLFEFNERELRDIIKLKKEQDDIRAAFYKDINAKMRALEQFLKANPYTKNEKEKEDLDNLTLAEPPFMPDPRTFLAETNEKAFQKYLKHCKPRNRSGEVNLRQYRICGGVLNLDLIITPPQPKRMRNSILVTTLQLPATLQSMKYQVQYRAPPPPAPGVIRTPLEIEQENKKIAAQYEKLAQVFIDLPQDVMWTEPPVVCQWQESRSLWTTNYINDYKFNEDKLNVQFRTGVLWPIGIASLKYGNLPYQGWELKPDPDGKGVVITVTGVYLTVTWKCVGNYVKLMFIANATTSALKEHFYKPYTVKRMVQLMRTAGVDFFPEFDAHNNVEGSCPKEWALERHLYHAMAFLSRAYNFQWSRWNVGAGSRAIIIQHREAVDKKRAGKLTLLNVTPQRATILKCNEMTTEINYDAMSGLPFFPDLFTLDMSYGSVDARRTAFNMKYRLVESVFEMLQELKLCSFS